MSVRGRALGALLQRTVALSSSMRCAAQRHEPSTNPCVAVRGGRSGPAGVPDTDVGHFSSGQEPGRKARPPLTHWLGRRPGQRHAGCPFFWLLFFEQAKKSDPGRGSGSEARRRRAQSRKTATKTSRTTCLKNECCRPARKAVAHWVRFYKEMIAARRESNPGRGSGSEARRPTGTPCGRRRAGSRKKATKTSRTTCLKNECCRPARKAVAHWVRSYKGMIATRRESDPGRGSGSEARRRRAQSR